MPQYNRARMVRYDDPVSRSVTACIPHALYERLEAICKRRKVCKAEFLRCVLEQAVTAAETQDMNG